MKRDDIRGLVRSVPFKPFRLHLADGKTFRIPHPDFALLTAHHLVVAKELAGGVPAGINLVRYEDIVRAEILPRKARKKS